MKLFFQTIFLSLYVLTLHGQDVMMQGWYWDYPKSECDGVDPWAVQLENKVNDLTEAGITMVWLPPVSRASFGNCSNGYDPLDLYDLGEFGGGATGFGTRTQLDALIASLDASNILAVADVVYNHRDGGEWEDNPAVKVYINDYPGDCNPATPYPVNGKARYILPLGGASSHGAGDYYFKISSASGDAGFHGSQYNIYFETNTVGWANLPDESESEPNGGGDCGEGNNQVNLGINYNCVEETTTGCNTDEFHLELEESDFDGMGDSLFIYIEEINGGGTGIDVRPYGIWSGSESADIIDDLVLQTRTDFSNLPSGQGAMNFLNFKPNGINPSCLTGDWDYPYFFFDIEEDQTSTLDVYKGWTEWLWDEVGFKGFRMDAVKHFDPSLISDMLSYLEAQTILPEMMVGELFDTNPFNLLSWVNSVTSPEEVNMRAFDFALRSALKEACDNTSYDVRNVFESGIVDAAGGSGYNSVTFINNHDYRGPGEPVQNNPLLAYAYILTNNKVGLPCVFYPDYFGESVPNYPTINLSEEINRLIEIQNLYIAGSETHTYLNEFGSSYSANFISGNSDDVLIFQMSNVDNGHEIIVAINFGSGSLQLDHEVNMTNLFIGEQLTDMLGNSNFPTAVVSGSNQIYIDLPAHSYSVWSNCDVSEPTCVPLDYIKPKLFLGGCFDSDMMLMDDQLRLNGLVPLSEPYTDLGYNFTLGGAEVIGQEVLDTEGNDAIVDWVILELRDKLDPSNIVLSMSGLLQRDGDIVHTDGLSAPDFSQVSIDDYYLAIRHRNHLGAMTADPININSGEIIDFTDPNTATYGIDALKQQGDQMLMWPGDANNNGVISYNGANNDKNSILSQVGLFTPNGVENGYFLNDVNMDGQVKYNGSSNDKNSILSQVGLFTPNEIIEEQLP